MDKETDMMIKAVNENHQKELNKSLLKEKQLKEETHEKRIINIAIAILIIIIFIFVLIIQDMDIKSINRCVKAGYDIDLCEKQISK